MNSNRPVVPRWDELSHEHVAFVHDQSTGLRAIIAIHSTTLGPALGGTRWYDYRSVDQALFDVLRLSEAMSYKAAAAGLNLGGGKAVIIGDPEEQRTDAFLEAYGRVVDGFGGRYITAEDVGTTVEDMGAIRRVTPHVAGLPLHLGGSGDPSPATARGVHAAMRAAAVHQWGSRELKGRRVLVSGVGKVGSALVGRLVDEGCDVVVADIDEGAVRVVRERHGVSVVPVDDALRTECDLLSPAAMGGVLNPSTIGDLRCEIVVGSANNQLEQPDRDARLLADRGILYVPDFVANAGGLINISEELHGFEGARAKTAIDAIEGSVIRTLTRATDLNLSTHEAAIQLAKARIQGSAAAGMVSL